MPVTSVHTVEADGVRVFYREAGDPSAPVVLLLHGFPTSSFMFRELIPRLADDYRVIAPDLPGFGFTEVPAERKYVYSFDGLSATINAFTQALKLRRFALYVFDYGAPTGFRLAMAHPDRYQRRLSFPKIILKRRIELHVRRVIEKQIKLNIFIPRTLQQSRIQRVRFRRNTLRVGYAVRVLPARSFHCQNDLAEHLPVF